MGLSVTTPVPLFNMESRVGFLDETGIGLFGGDTTIRESKYTAENKGKLEVSLRDVLRPV